MPDENDAFEDREPRFTATPPTTGWVYLRVGGDTLTAFEIQEGEELELYVEQDNPRAAEN